MYKNILLIFISLLLLFGCGRSEKEKQESKRQEIIQKLNSIDSQLIQGRNKLNSLIQNNDSKYQLQHLPYQ